MILPARDRPQSPINSPPSRVALNCYLSPPLRGRRWPHAHRTTGSSCSAAVVLAFTARAGHDRAITCTKRRLQGTLSGSALAARMAESRRDRTFFRDPPIGSADPRAFVASGRMSGIDVLRTSQTAPLTGAGGLDLGLGVRIIPFVNQQCTACRRRSCPPGKTQFFPK